MGAIHTHSDNAGGAPAPKGNSFDKNPSAFRAVRHQIIRPFKADFDRAKILCGARQGNASNEAELRRNRTRAGIDHEAAGVQVAPRRDPATAAAASARSLFIRHNPQAIGVAGQGATARLLVGRIDGAES